MITEDWRCHRNACPSLLLYIGYVPSLGRSLCQQPCYRGHCQCFCVFFQCWCVDACLHGCVSVILALCLVMGTLRVTLGHNARQLSDQLRSSVTSSGQPKGLLCFLVLRFHRSGCLSCSHSHRAHSQSDAIFLFGRALKKKKRSVNIFRENVPFKHWGMFVLCVRECFWRIIFPWTI